jgi:hypothetical protein
LGISRSPPQAKMWGIKMWGQPPRLSVERNSNPCCKQKCPPVRNERKGVTITGRSLGRDPATACRTPRCF